MAVNKSDRKKSRTEYDNSFFVVYHDAVNLCRLHLGAKGETFECNKGYIARMSNKILDSVTDMGKYIRIANSIYPIYKSELEEIDAESVTLKYEENGKLIEQIYIFDRR